MAIGSLVSAGLSFAGARKQKKEARKYAKDLEKQAREQAVFSDIQAQGVRATGQMRALEEVRQAKLVASRAVAVAAAGGMVEDILPLLADIEGEGAYRASIANMEAETEARRLKFEGQQGIKYAKTVGDAERRKADAAMLPAFGSLLTAGFDVYRRYGKST